MDPRLKSAAGTFALLTALFLLLPFAMKEQPHWMGGPSAPQFSDLDSTPAAARSEVKPAGQRKLADSTALWSARTESVFTGLEEQPSGADGGLQEFPKVKENGLQHVEQPKIGPLTRVAGVMEGGGGAGSSAAAIQARQASTQVSGPQANSRSLSGSPASWRSLRESKKTGEGRSSSGSGAGGAGANQMLFSGKSTEGGGAGGGNSRFFGVGTGAESAADNDQDGSVGGDITQAIKTVKGAGGGGDGGMGSIGGPLGGGDEGGGGGASAEEIVNDANQAAQKEATDKATLTQETPTETKTDNNTEKTTINENKDDKQEDKKDDKKDEKKDDENQVASTSVSEKDPRSYKSYDECVKELTMKNCGISAQDWSVRYGPQARKADGIRVATDNCARYGSLKCTVTWTDSFENPVIVQTNCAGGFRKVLTNKPRNGDYVCIKVPDNYGVFRPTGDPWIPYEGVKKSECLRGVVDTGKPEPNDMACR